MIFGTFDILHQGHLSVFKAARRAGDHVITVVARDTTVKKHKQHPIHTELERKRMLECISLIDEVVLGCKKNPYKIIKNKQPDIILLGYDQKVFVDQLKEKLKEFGLSTKVKRLPSYKPKTYKSNKIRQKMEKSM
ncbi:MAG: adenylyltransferase/cytidyltransferase family protein [Candidatus Magasanikbacteria bacterium]|nr:adenylyltransferase/cytidyltransferase family protein [Candidatus Magasanikbacteria bacterium]